MRLAKVDCAQAMAHHSERKQWPMRGLALLCILLLFAACAPTEMPSASVELTQGSMVEERRAIGTAVMEHLAGTLRQRVKLRVPDATNTTLDSLTLNVLTEETPVPGGGTSTKVSLVCFFAHDVSASDANQTLVLDACKSEVEKALGRIVRSVT